MAGVKVLMIPIACPGDVLKIQDILAEALKQDRVQSLHSIRCKCGTDGCDKDAAELLARYQDAMTKRRDSTKKGA